MEIYIIYGITDCPACLMAQAVLMEAGIEYAFVEMDFSRTYRESVKEEFQWNTFPVIIRIDPEAEELVGGYDELISELEEKIKAPTGIVH
tara:strand:- start:255 stop:524 length:270 start_codon:yes stop_codon:yes gene_type:complete